MTILKIAQLQLPVYTQKSETLALLERTMQEVVSTRVDLITLPEMFCCPYQMDNFPIYAELEGGPVWQACSELAKKYHILLCAGSMPEKDSSGRIYNTAYVFDRRGARSPAPQRTCRYRRQRRPGFKETKH